MAFHKKADHRGKQEGQDGFRKKNSRQRIYSETLEKSALSEIIDLDCAAAHRHLDAGDPDKRFGFVRIDAQDPLQKYNRLMPLHQAVMPVG